MRNQKIEFELDKELPKEAVNTIVYILRDVGADDINIDFINRKEDRGSYE
jgi:hypothetical protein